MKRSLSSNQLDSPWVTRGVGFHVKRYSDNNSDQTTKIINIKVWGDSENYTRSQWEPVGDVEVGICPISNINC